MFPLFRHVGANNTTPELCDCQTLTAEELSSPSHNCNVFRFLSGFMFVSAPAAASAGYVMGLTLGKLKGNLALLNEHSHHAMFAASTFGQHSAFSHVFNSPASLDAAYEFCRVGDQTCSILTFATYDLVPTNWAVSKQYTLLQNGACRDTISPTDEHW
jgi:hypothetical protein